MAKKSFFGDMHLKFKYGLKFNKPLFLWRLFKTYFGIVFLGKKPLKYIDFAIDYRCNLKCEHCFAGKLTKPGAKQMSVEDYKRVAKEAMELGAIDFSFQGGEVFLYKPLLEKVIKAFKPKMNLISITTNATMIDRSMILKLKKLGVDHLNVSLDSGIAEEHDEFRGMKGTFKKATDAIDIALKNGMNITISTTVTHKSLYSEGFKKLVEFSKKRKILLNTIFAAPVGRWEKNKDVVLSEADVRYVNKLRKKNPLLRRDIDSNYIKWGCGAVKEVFYITPYGDVFPCPFIHISLGNVLKEPLKKIRKRALKIKCFDHYHKKCLATEDRDFMKRYCSWMDAGKKPILNYNEVFDIKKRQK